MSGDAVPFYLSDDKGVIILSNVLKAIIIDDSPVDAELVLYEISKSYRVEHINLDNENELREALREKTWDIVLCDYSMPAFDPFRAISVLREYDMDIPLIVISGTIGEEKAIHLLKAGCGDCILKTNLTRLPGVIDREMHDALVRKENRELNRKLQKYQLLSNEANDAMLFLNSHGKILDANRAAIRRYGYSYQELLALNIADLRRENDQRILNNQIEEAAEKGIVFETVHYRKDGSAINEEMSVQSAVLEEKTILLSIIRDITERKIAQNRLNASETSYRQLFESAKDGILILNAETGKITDVNPYLISLLGYSKDELVEKRIWEIGSFVDFVSNRDKFIQLQSQGYIRYDDMPLQTVDGRQIDVEFVSTMYTVNQINVIQCNIRDITERVKAEAEVKHERDTAKLYLNTAGVILLAIGRDEKVKVINAKGCEILGLTEENILGKNWFDCFVPEYEITKIKEIFNDLISGMTDDEDYHENAIITADGQERYIFWHNTALRSDNGDIIGTFSSGTDITERRLTKNALMESERKYSNYIENAPDGVFVTDESGNFLETNKAANVMMGYSRDEHLEKTMLDCLAPEAVEDGIQYFKRLREVGSAEAELPYKPKNGAERWWNINSVVLSDSRILGFIKDITDRKKAQDELVHLSYHDILTGVYNRRFFEEELRRLDTSRNLPLSIIMCDINGLKLINDSFGHSAGDTMLSKAVGIIRASCRADDRIARLGGDEFVVILPKTDSAKAKQITRRIESLAVKENVEGVELSLSAGYDTKTDASHRISEVLSNAENHMYRRKIVERSSMRSETIDIIMKTLFEKSSRESMHSNRVSRLCESIATGMNLNKDDIDQIRIAGLLHDIGKIGVDDTILNKAERLNGHEWKEIKRHPEVGWRILSSTKEFLKLAQCILQHHEKWDGTGYPNGLRGEEISLEARIITVADAYDAMTSVRSYKKELARDEAIEEIKRCAGTHFDPQIAALFIELQFADSGAISSP